VSRDRSVYLRHMADLLERVRSYTSEGEAAFHADPKTQDAVLHNLEIIGQCVKDYGIDDLARACPRLPWAQIAGFRNVLAHQYLGVDIGLVCCGDGVRSCLLPATDFDGRHASRRQVLADS
jgi:uncharacterized protein with HEPN domain